MPKLLEVGPIRLAVLNPNGSKQKTLILPPPNAKGGLKLEWLNVGVYDYEFEMGGRGTRVIDNPHIPKLTVTWGPYADYPEDDVSSGMYPLGNTDLHRPTWEQLMELTSAPYWGRLRISPGMNAGGFTVSKVEDKSYGLVHGSDYCEQIELTFYGTNGQATKTLEAF